MDTVFGERCYLWRAVDQDHQVIEILAQRRKDTRAAARFFKKMLKHQGRTPHHPGVLPGIAVRVKVDFIVRDTCRLRPGIPGLSEQVRVVSIAGRFLDHAIYYFRNSGEEEYFVGSADCMTRNFESRVEVVTPVEKPDLRVRLPEILEVQLNDQRSAWDMQADATHCQRCPVDVTAEARRRS